MKYKSGDFQKILGISRETLRFFESKNLVSPIRDVMNNYRYYDTLDLNKIVAYKFYRSLEFSLDDAIEMVNVGNEAQLEMLARHIVNIEKKAEHYSELLRCISEYKQSYKRLHELADNPIIEYIDSAIFYFNQKNDVFVIDDDVSENTSIWLEHLPFVKIALIGSIEESKTVSDIYYGYGVTSEYKSICKKLISNATKAYPIRKCVHGLIRCKSTVDNITYNDFLPLLKKAEEKGYNCKEEFICWMINEENLGDTKEQYLDCYIEVYEKDLT
ncbi:MAG: MerR family transcriptional regulator [Lachnospirales bacterium]